MDLGATNDILMYRFKKKEKCFLEEYRFKQWNYGFWNLFLTFYF